MKIFRNIVFLIQILLFTNALNGQVLNIEKYRKKNDTTEWGAEFGLNLSLLKTTKKINSVTNYFNLDYKQGRSAFFLISKINWMEADNESLSKNGFYHIRYNYKLLKMLTVEAFMQYQYNHQMDIRSRELYGSGLRYKLSELDNFRCYIGSSIMFEEEQMLSTREVNKGISLSNYLSFTIFVSGENKIVSTTYHQPKCKDFKDYRISSETNLVLKIAKGFSLGTGFEFTYQSKPPLNVPDFMYVFSNSIIYRLD